MSIFATAQCGKITSKIKGNHSTHLRPHGQINGDNFAPLWSNIDITWVTLGTTWKPFGNYNYNYSRALVGTTW